ncbi:MAG: phospho-N-acetylmuramoyl-pentapeptide-transferase [Clostridia bacterium]|nr:phospho-N-acetylmuramoyl-pentapeptide-transferase [Clostridia bacterium]
MSVYLSVSIISFCLSFIFCAVLIPVLKKRKAGQFILSYVKEHNQKSGTPTMGGLAFILAASIAAILFIEKFSRTFGVALTIGISYMLVGFLDDLLKRHRKQNQGLTAAQKIIFQTFVAVLAAIYCLRAELTTLNLPFLGVEIDLGFWIFPLAVFVFLATVNTVNLTDGLDGLAAGTSIPFFIVMGVLCVWNEQSGLSVLAFALAAALAAYLFFNSPPASVFMGDTGSLSLGGFAASIGVFSGNALYIALVGIMFVVSGISVIVQVIYYKATGGKRVFLMSPVHHHFQQRGYSESKIAYAYSAITTFAGLIALLGAL